MAEPMGMFMGHPSQSLTVCSDTSCLRRRQAWQKGTVASEQQTERVLQRLEHNVDVLWTKHLDEREVSRKISSLQTTEALKNGSCIWHRRFLDATGRWVDKWIWLGYAKTGHKTYRPLHLVLCQKQGEAWITVLTVYDPSDSNGLWDKTFTQRMCWHTDPL
ncbi:hypothetical protein [Alicyclobacillus sp. SP_1]|uniref:hypothetical protein n=1 Tax=Alicyclobacillus sp. SP_1 TaxID=2942475 RepID=UPI002158954B|nr:hypothetical protein [Alicyclobacillus sp. SP_1]